MRVVSYRRHGGASVVVPTKTADERGKRARRAPSEIEPAWRGYAGPKNWSQSIEDGPAIPAGRIERIKSDVFRCLTHGAWSLAEACATGARGDKCLTATDEQIARHGDGWRLPEQSARLIADTVGFWLGRASVNAARASIERRRTDEQLLWTH